MRARGSADAPRLAGDGGSIIVEAALVLPLLAVIFLGIFDFGMAWRQRGFLTSATGAAARQAAAANNLRHADLLALQSALSTMTGTDQVDVDKIVIFKNTAVSGNPTNSACLTLDPTTAGTGVTGACNVYGPTQFANLTNTYFGSPTATTCVSPQYDRFWCPTGRKVYQGDPPDFIGVYMEATYTPFSGLWGTTFTLSDKQVMQIEPKVI